VPYNHNVFNHIRAVKQCAAQLQLNARLDVKTFKLGLRGRGRSVELLPQFLCRANGQFSYSPQLRAGNVVGFLGWRPYFNKVWPNAVDKSSFKDFCRSRGLLTPQSFKSVKDVDTDVLIKKARSSFGQGIIGPLQLSSLGAADYSLGDGEYFEQFIRGDIVKIWYWDNQIACVALDPMPEVIGDGVSTLRQLITARKTQASLDSPTDNDVWEAVARYQGYTLAAVPPSQKSVLVDFRYQSSLHPPVFSNNNALARIRESALLSELEKIGSILWTAIPDATRPKTLYTVDAIVDKNGKVWLLEMNCNPLVHVDAYKPMIDSLFETNSTVGTT
jgi:hypothetical protein